MTFHNPLALWAGAVFIPALLALYFLRLRRVEATVSSTMLWRRSVEDLQVNSLLQRLRRNILLVLQLAFVAGLVAVPAIPGCGDNPLGGRSVIIVLDNSASMATKDGEAQDSLTRLEIMKAEAAKLLAGLWTRQTGDQAGQAIRAPDEAMVITFADRPEIVRSFSRDIPLLQADVRGVKVRHGRSDLAAALKVVAGQAELRSNPPHVYIFTDGKVTGPGAELALGVERLEVVIPPRPVSGESDNLGISSFRVIRTLGANESLRAVAEVINAAPRELSTGLVVRVDGTELPLSLPEVRVPPRERSRREDGREDPGLRLLSFELPTTYRAADGRTRPVAGVIQIELTRPDNLSLDNRAWDVAPPPLRPRGLLVTAGPTSPSASRVVAAVTAVDFADFEVVAADQFRPDKLETGAFDVVIFDGHRPDRPPPPGQYLMLGVTPPYDDMTPAGSLGKPQVLVNWQDSRHVLMQDVVLGSVSIYEALDWTLPAGGIWLAEGLAGDRSTPLVAEVVREGSTYVVVGFAVNPQVGQTINTDWWIQPSFPMFVHNAVKYLGTRANTSVGGQLAVGEPIDVPVGPQVTRGVLTDAAGRRHDLTANGGRLTFADTSQVGVYRLSLIESGGAENPTAEMAFAVNLFDRIESDTSPLVGDLAINYQAAATAEGVAEQRHDAWRWILWGCLGVLTLEWWIYNRKVHL